MKTTDFIVEYAGIGNDAEAMGQDHEVQLARQDLYNTAKNAIELHARLKSISEETGLEGWVSEKITLAADYLATVNNYFAEQDQPDMNMLDSFSFESAEQQYDQLVNESASHSDEEEDKKLIKKMVKPGALKDGKVDEAFPHDVDHMPGQTAKNPMSGCKRCHGYGKIWKSPDGTVLSGNNAPGAKQYKCGACKGIGFVKEESVTETSKGKIDRYTKAASDAHGHADFMARAAGPGQEKFAQDQRKIADKRAAGLRRAAERGEKSDVEENKDNEPFNYEEWKASSVKPRKPRGYKDAEALGQQQREIDRKKKEKVAEADKHSIVGKIQRGHELKKKVDSTWNDLSTAQKAGDGSAASRAFKKHERYANLERPGTWTKVKEESSQQDMTGQTCEKCKKGTYQERSQHDDMEGKVSCSCGNRVDRWKNYQAEGVVDIVKGIKRKVAGKQDPAEVQYQHGFRARQAIDASRKFNNQAAYDNEKKMVDRYNKVHKVVNKEGVEEGYTVTRGIDRERYQERAGLEGPFATKIGKVVYYDPREGKYYDPDTDMYIEYDDWHAMNEASDPSGIFTAAQYNHAFIVSAEVDGKRKKFRVYHQNAELAKKKFLQHHSMATVTDVKPETVNELDTSTMQAYLNKRKETATPASAHQAVKQAQGVRTAREKIADKEVMKKAQQVGRVTESRSPVNDFGIDIRTIKKSDKVYIDLDGRRKAFVVINKTTFPNGMFAIKVADKTQATGYSLVNFLDVEKVSKAARVSENELTELSNATLNAYIPRANRSREAATRNMQASGKYDPKVDEKMGRRAEFTMKAANKVNEEDQAQEYTHSYGHEFNEWKHRLEQKHGIGKIEFLGDGNVADAYHVDTGEHLGYIDGAHFSESATGLPTRTKKPGTGMPRPSTKPVKPGTGMPRPSTKPRKPGTGMSAGFGKGY